MKGHASARRRRHIRIFTFILAAFATAWRLAQAAELPVIPVGLDAYRQWDRWPMQRIGARAYMRSTYDRTGGNRSADASHYLFQLATNYNVSLDVEGPGILYFARYNHWHGSPWRYIVDGTEHIVQESTSSDPTKPVPNSIFLPEKQFPTPLTWTWSATKGADLMWVPIPFEKSFRMAYSRTRYGTGYYIYHLYDRSARLSQPIKAWSDRDIPARDVLELIARSGTDISPRISSNGSEAKGTLSQIAANEVALISTMQNVPAVVRKITVSVSKEQALALGRTRLRVTWDNRKAPSIDAPVALFFGAGTLYNRDGREYLVKAFPMNIRYAADRVELACYFPMPFFRNARFELVGPAGEGLRDVSWTIAVDELRNPPRELGYFHASYRDHREPKRGEDLVCLDTRNLEGSADWSGNFVGMSWIFSDRAVLGTLEGDPRFFFDDSESPQAYGTGTEEWGGGGDYWGGLNMTLPFAGHPVGARNAKEARSEEDKIESAYRFLLADLMPFGKRALIRLEHGGVNDSAEHYQTVTYWYGAPATALVKTDELKIGNNASERAHQYESPKASEPYDITSRYELGPDVLPSVEQEHPLAEPTSFADFEFEAPAGTYFIWLRGANLDNSNITDASWLQFDSDIGTTRMAPSYQHEKGFGNWLDAFPASRYAWSSALPQEPPRTVTFSSGGKHKLRIQPRHGGHNIDQIWLSLSQKTRPTDLSRQTARPGEIVINASTAKIGGSMKLIEDARAGAGKLLHVGGAGGTEQVIYPAHTDRGRKMTGASEFSLKLDPDNLGVLLRRKLDYQFPNQRAEVFVGSDRGGEFKSAGIWYLAGANTCVYSDPQGELGATQHIVVTSNRRFRDDEFLIPRDLTQGRSSIRVRIEFKPVSIPLFPGHPLAELAWSEIRYDAYCYVMPDWKP